MNLNNNEIEKNPPEKEIKFILGLFNSNKLEEAENEVNKQIIYYPNSSILYNILGAILASNNNLHEAISHYEKSIKINSNYGQAYNNLGTAFHKLNKMDEAILNYEKAISLNKNFAEAFNNLGNAFVDLKKSKDSLQYFKRALELKSNYAEAYNGLGAANEKLGNKNDALKNYQKATEIRSDYSEAYNNIGKLLSDQGKFDESLSNYKKAIKANPKYEKSYNNLGNLLNNLGNFDEATKAYKKAIDIKPDYAKAYSNLLFNLIYKKDFDIKFYLSEAKKFRKNCETIKKKISLDYKYDLKPKKLKVGFITADFGNHPGGFFTLSFLKELREKNYELIAYPTIERKDEISHHFKPLFSKWSLIEKKSDEEVVKEIINDGVHILIDAQGHSAKNRLTIFFYKPAPIQVSWLGQGSTGIPEIDYFVGSNHITPKKEDDHYVEKVLRLPEISQCFTPPEFDIEIKKLPAIENNFITFGSANKLTKVNDDVISLWSEILKSIPSSKIFLKNKDLDSEKIKNDIILKFKKNNINKEQLILEGEAKTRKELLNVYNKIDIGLDPFPFQGNTTTIESIWMGVPVITLKGNRYIFHFGESINSNLNMPNWIAKDHKDYISKAIKFSENIDELSNIRKNLRNKVLKSPIFNSKRFADHFDKMLWNIWETSLIKN